MLCEKWRLQVRSRINITFFAMFVSVLGLLAVSSGCHHRRMARGNGGAGIAPSDAAAEGKEAELSIVDKGGEDLPETEEIRRAYKLAPGADVEVFGINGGIEVETADSESAEVLIVRSAHKRDDLRFRKINIEHEPERLRIRVEDDRQSVFSAMGTFPEGRQRVMLKLPRRVDFRTVALNGKLTAGGIEGKLDLNGVNGPVKVERASGEVLFRGINGNIEATIAKLADEGIRITGVNGNTTLQFIGDVNATVEASGMHGQVEPNLPHVEVQGSEMFGGYKAKVGNGGPIRIRIDGVNGNVYLAKAGKDAAARSK